MGKEKAQDDGRGKMTRKELQEFTKKIHQPEAAVHDSSEEKDVLIAEAELEYTMKKSEM